ncbi:hypothetical protein CYLTODRAFT_422976 [Cylindrobasidium torrendii FP15055 ss-10]|uniref:STE3-domain-containing protein n=1 Tax=Cylindrobasidium torrendii FP15055 ss-10 TaxID=1314674 RepID=A0A0D7B901_9AGAR|nr:hypothetical protein CYLTODRAFT_422976 [Cylindrobasidium torrendii FP15055 ss-10]
MSIAPASSYVVWSIVSISLYTFLIYHIRAFDNFKCLRWNNDKSGAFKRFMTYAYLINVPLLIVFSLGYTVIKYKEGDIVHPLLGIIPKPQELWSSAHRAAVFPLNLAFSVAWSLEMVVHLEELCFWLFLVTSQTNPQQNWFKTVYFKIWVVGSGAALIFMPLVAIFTRENKARNEACTFLAGGLGSLVITIWFLPVLWSFNSFLRTLKAEGVDKSTIVKLTKFHELNGIRIFFRFIFTIPLVMLGADGITSHPRINTHQVAVELLTILAALACGASSAITLVIFYPRSIENELDDASAPTPGRLTQSIDSDVESVISRLEPPPDSFDDGASIMKFEPVESTHAMSNSAPPSRLTSTPCRSATDASAFQAYRSNAVNPMVHNFTSPIDMDHRMMRGPRMMRPRDRNRPPSHLTFN